MAALTTAYAGHADITSENAGAILNQFLPEDPPAGEGLGLVFIPERVVRAQKGLKTTIAWLETELGGPESTIPVPDLIASMLARKEAEGDDLELYLLYDPDNEDDVALVTSAFQAGIPVRDLAGAGDFLVFEEAAAEVPEEETPPWEPEAVAEAAAAEAAELADRAVPGLTEQFAGAAGVSVTLNLSPEAIDQLARAIVQAMTNQAARSVEVHGPVAAAVAPVVSIDKNRPAEPTGNTDTFPGAVAIYYNAEKGTYRKARGIARDGETKIYMGEEDAKAALALPQAK